MSFKGKIKSIEDRRQISIRNKGSGNGRAKHLIITSPTGNKYFCYGNFHSFCKEHKLPFSSMCRILHKTKTFDVGATVGWKVDYA
jgi:hypothetical protein